MGYSKETLWERERLTWIKVVPEEAIFPCWDGGTPMEDTKHMKELTDRLAVIGAPISEDDQVVTLLGSLPSSYKRQELRQELKQ